MYQKTFTNISTSATYIHTIDTQLVNSNYNIIDLRGHGYDTNTYSFPYADGAYSVGCYLDMATGLVTIRAGNLRSDGTQSISTTFVVQYITVQYTKTTD